MSKIIEAEKQIIAENLTTLIADDPTLTPDSISCWAKLAERHQCAIALDVATTALAGSCAARLRRMGIGFDVLAVPPDRRLIILNSEAAPKIFAQASEFVPAYPGDIPTIFKAH